MAVSLLSILLFLQSCIFIASAQPTHR
jgi:hypothetical protein